MYFFYLYLSSHFLCNSSDNFFLTFFWYFITNLNQNLFLPFISMLCVIQFIVHLRELVLKISDLSLVLFLLHLHLKKPDQEKSDRIFSFVQILICSFKYYKDTSIYSHVLHKGMGYNEAEKRNVRGVKMRTLK